MLSCAAIQKLERYAQFGLKRNNVDDFVLTSVKDPKRANIFGLTHLTTWKETHHAILGLDTDSTAAAPPQQQQQSLIRITDHFIYAVSFAAGFVRHHVHTALFPLLVSDDCSDPDDPHRTLSQWEEQLLSPQVVQKRREHAAFEKVFLPREGGVPTEKEDGTALSPDAQALQLLHFWRDILLKIAQDAGRSTPHRDVGVDGETAAPHSAFTSLLLVHSPALTQAVAHLLKTLFDLLTLLLSAVMVLQPASALQSGTAASAAESLGFLLLMRDEVLVLTAAATRIFRRASSHAPLDKELQQRNTAAIGLRSVIKSCGGSPPSATTKASEGATDALYAYVMRHLSTASSGVASSTSLPPPFVVLVFACFVDSSSSGVLESLTLFQRSALLHATLGASCLRDSAEMTTANEGAATQTPVRPQPPAFTPLQRRNFTEALMRSLCLAWNSVTCNKPTRLVVYYRGEEMALLQSNVRDAQTYSLHTFVTSAPIDPAIKEPFLELVDPSYLAQPSSDSLALSRSNPTTSPLYPRRGALQLLIWMVSAPFFYASFCTHDSWKEMAKEQRRMVLLQRAGKRKQQQEQQQRDRRQRRAGSDSSARGVSTGRTGTSEGPLEGVPSSAASYTSVMSAESRASRLSMLSTLSAASAASFESFLSILPPEAEDVEGRERHESEDGNSNLPLILLEECVLALYSFMQAYPPSFTGRYGLREAAWDNIAKCFTIVQSTLTSASTLSTAGGEGASAAAYLQWVAPTASVTSALFDLGQDVQYNHGLGYECLALLFASVVAPRLELDSTTSPSSNTTVEPNSVLQQYVWYRPSDPVSVQQHLESALAACLTTYEVVAPQVVDRYLRTILQMAARAIHTHTPATAREEEDGATANAPHRASAAPLQGKRGLLPLVEGRDDEDDDAAWRSRRNRKEASMAPSSPQLGVQFLCALVERLGRSNQLPMFLDALFASSSIAPYLSSEAQARNGVSATTPSTDLSLSSHLLCTALQHDVIRESFLRACSVAMDAEQLLQYFTGLLTAVTTGVEEHHADLPQPQCIALLLHTLSLTLVGLPCSSVISRRVLELTTELELLLVGFMNQCIETLLCGAPVGEQTEVQQRQWRCILWRAGLGALYHCRALTAECLQDLGEDNISDYVVMLEETLWQVSEKVEAICGLEKSVDELESLVADSGEECASTSASIVVFLVLQRLSLARTVAVLLQREEAIRVSQAGALKPLVRCILDKLSLYRAVSLESPGPEGAARRTAAAWTAVSAANRMTVEEWRAVACWSGNHHKRLRTALVALLEATFCMAPQLARSDSSVSQPQTLVGPATAAVFVWLRRCWRSVGGPLLRAVTDVFLQHFVDEDLRVQEADALHTHTATPIALATEVLLWAYDNSGNVPYWPSLLDHSLCSLKRCVRLLKEVRSHTADKLSSTHLADSAEGDEETEETLRMAAAPNKKKIRQEPVRAAPQRTSYSAAPHRLHKAEWRHQHLEHLLQQLLLLMSRCVLSEPQSQSTLTRVLGHVLLQQRLHHTSKPSSRAVEERVEDDLSEQGEAGKRGSAEESLIVPWWTANAGANRSGAVKRGVHPDYMHHVGVPVATLSEVSQNLHRHHKRPRNDEEEAQPLLHEQKTPRRDPPLELLREWCFEEELIHLCETLWVDRTWMEDTVPSLLFCGANPSENSPGQHAVPSVHATFMEFMHVLYGVTLRTAEELHKCAAVVTETEGKASAKRNAGPTKTFTPKDLSRCARELRQYAQTTVMLFLRPGVAPHSSGETHNTTHCVAATCLLPFLRAAASASSSLGPLSLNSLTDPEDPHLLVLKDSWKELFYTLLLNVMQRAKCVEEDESSAATTRSHSSTAPSHNTSRGSTPGKRKQKRLESDSPDESSDLDEGSNMKLHEEALSSLAAAQAWEDACSCINLLYPLLRRLLGVKPSTGAPSSKPNSHSRGKSYTPEYYDTHLAEVLFPSCSSGEPPSRLQHLSQLTTRTLTSLFLVAPPSSIVQEAERRAPTENRKTRRSAEEQSGVEASLLAVVRNMLSFLQLGAASTSRALQHFTRSRSSPSVSLPLQLQSSSSSLVTLWILIKMVEMCRSQHATPRLEDPLPFTPSGVLSVVLSNYTTSWQTTSAEGSPSPTPPPASGSRGKHPPSLRRTTPLRVEEMALSLVQPLLQSARHSSPQRLQLWPSQCLADVYHRMQQLVAVQESLAVLEATAAPAALHQLLHALLQHLLGLANWSSVTSTTVASERFTASITAQPLQRCGVARAACLVGAYVLHRLFTRVSGMKPAALQRSVLQLLQAANHLCLSFATQCSATVPALEGRKLAEEEEGMEKLLQCSTRPLRRTVLGLLVLPRPLLFGTSPAAEEWEEAWMEASWHFVSAIVEQAVSAIPSRKAPLRDRRHSAAEEAHVSQAEMTLILTLLTRHWLRESASRSQSGNHGSVLWSRAERLPVLLSGLLEVLLANIAAERYTVEILHAFSAMLFHLTREAEELPATAAGGQRHSTAAPSSGADRSPPRATRRTEATEVESSPSAPGTAHTAARLHANAQRLQQQRRLFALASATAAMFQTCDKYVSVFTAYSGDTDGLVMDLLRCLQKSKLPKKLAPPISFRKGRLAPRPQEDGPDSTRTLSDLVYMSVGSLEGRSVLRQAAERLEEQEGVSGGSLIGRQLFQVE